MEKVVTFFKSFTTIFYFILLVWEGPLWIRQSLIGFEFRLKSNQPTVARDCTRGPHVGDPFPSPALCQPCGAALPVRACQPRAAMWRPPNGPPPLPPVAAPPIKATERHRRPFSPFTLFSPI
jgi:hypothetical protein